MKARCSVCGQDRRARNTRGGDGSAVIICRHARTMYDRMNGARVQVECSGSFATVDDPGPSPAVLHREGGPEQ